MCLRRRHFIKTNPHMICKQASFFFELQCIAHQNNIFTELCNAVAIPHSLLKLRGIRSFSYIFFSTLHKHSKNRTPLEKQAPARPQSGWGITEPAAPVGPAPVPLIPAVARGSVGTTPCTGWRGVSTPPAPCRRQGTIQMPVAVTYG